MFALCGLWALVVVHRDGEGDLGDRQRPPVRSTRSGWQPPAPGSGSSMIVGAARKEITEGLLVRVLVNWDMGEVELHAVFPARKAAKPSAPSFVDLLVSSTVVIFPSGSDLRSEFPRNQRASHLLTPRAPPQRVKPGKSFQIAAKKGGSASAASGKTRDGWHF